jgi:hypothetical protein
MLEQVNVCRSTYASRHSISKIRKYLDEVTVKTLVHAFITCKLDNSILAGIPDYAMNKLYKWFKIMWHA